MSETTMPAAEAAPVLLDDERNAYELAFHILPTVAEGEVPGVFDSIKALITKDKGEIFDEEAPERFELAYEIVKHMDRNMCRCGTYLRILKAIEIASGTSREVRK